MSYTINKTDGTTLVTLKDGTIDTATSDVALFGKGYVNRMIGTRSNVTKPIKMDKNLSLIHI